VPSREISSPPPLVLDASSVVPSTRSRTKTSGLPLVSPGTRLADEETKATRVPSGEMAKRFDATSPWATMPLSVARTTRLPLVRSRTISRAGMTFATW